MKKTNELRVFDTPIDDLLIVDLPLHKDSRGWFKENWQREKMIEAGLPDFRPVQNNVSFNHSRGTTRGMHAEPWDKFVSVVHGEVYGAWVDLRPGPSFGKVFCSKIGVGQAVFVPRGVANGFQTLAENTVYSYLVTDHWKQSSVPEYRYVNLADPTIRIPWPIDLQEAVISDADRSHPLLHRSRPMEPKKILVLGGSGQLGKAFAKLATTDRRIKLLTRDDADLQDPNFAENLDLSACSHVVNAAAMTAVDVAETMRGRALAWKINSEAVRQLAQQCAAQGVALMQVSTDYVFDGNTSDVSEDHPISPLNVYGQSKAAGEQAVLAFRANFVIRTSWVIGEGHNFVASMKRLAATQVCPDVVDDQYGRLTFADELAGAIMHLIDSDSDPGIYHLQGAGPVQSWFEIAKMVFELCGRESSDIQPVKSDDYAAKYETAAQRPRLSVFNMEKIEGTGFKWTPEEQLLASYLDDSQVKP